MPESPLEFNQAVERDLRLLSASVNYHKWIVESITPYLGRRLMEIGSGIGAYSKYFLGRERLLLSEYDPKYMEILREKYSKESGVEVIGFDLENPSAQVMSVIQDERIDTIININVLEHIKREEELIGFFAGCLRPGGRVVTMVPAFQMLYSRLDAEYGHLRRYSRADAGRLAASSGMRLAGAYYFNILGMVGWTWTHRLMGRTALSPVQTALFDRMIPYIKWLDAAALRSAGMSLVFILEKE